MKNRLSLTIPLGLVMALALTACSAAPAIPSIGIPGVGGPTLAPGQTAVAGTACAAFPTHDPLSSAEPSMPVDSTLLAELPAQVAGQPTTDLSAVPFLATMCLIGGEAAADQLLTTTSVLGFNLATMSVGNFTASVNGDSVTVTALRAPGQDASQLMTNFGLFGAFAGISATAAGLTTANLGGKNVSVSAGSSGSKSYFYTHGDTLFIIDSSNDADAGAVLQALP